MLAVKPSLFKKAVGVYAAVLLIALCGLPQVKAQATNDWLINQATRKFDANQDGVLQKSEVTGRLKDNFDRFDKNSDGQLDQDEMLALANQFGKRVADRLKNNSKGAWQKKIPVPKTINRKTDVRYRKGGSNSWKLDILWPKAKPKTPRPAIVFVHGGGWSGGDKDNGLWRNMPIAYAEKGYVCISVNYRLTGESPLPACVSDCKNAVRWLRANAEKYHVDPNRIGAFGSSAGGHLVAMLGVAGADAKLEGDGPYQEYSSEVNAVCCIAAPTNFQKWYGEEIHITEINPKLERIFGDNDVNKIRDVAIKVSPITWVKSQTKSSVSFLVIHGTDDLTVPVFQGNSFAKALEDAEFDVTYLKFDGAGHGVFYEEKQKTEPAVEGFFARTLKLAKHESSKD